MSRILSPAKLRAVTAKRFALITHSKQQKTIDFVLKPELLDSKQHAWMSAALYGMCRFYPRYKNELAHRLEKPFKEKDASLCSLEEMIWANSSPLRMLFNAAKWDTRNGLLTKSRDGNLCDFLQDFAVLENLLCGGLLVQPGARARARTLALVRRGGIRELSGGGGELAETGHSCD